MGKHKSLTAPGQASGSLGGTARQASLRAANLRLLLQLVYAAAEPPSRADLAAQTGMTRATASRLVDELLAAALIGENPPEPATGPGRPAARLTPAVGTYAAIGAEVTTSALTVRLIDLSGAVLDEHHHPVDLGASDPQRTLASLGRLIDALAPPRGVRLLGAGITLPGLVTPPGRLLSAPNLGWRDLDPVPLLASRRLRGLDVRVGNEADLAAHALTRLQPGRPSVHCDLLYVSAEVGIGGAIVLDGVPLRGRHGWAGEIGHVTVDPAGPQCRCGSNGCLERYAGREALRTHAGVDAGLDPKAFADLVRAGHAGANAALAQAGWALGIALAGSVNMLDVPLVVLGGDLALLMEPLRPVIFSELARRLLAAPWATPELLAAPGPHLAATGAAYRVLDDALTSLPGLV